MCTVSFIKHNDGFSLTSNRDEQSTRPTLPPQVYLENDKQIIYPKDKIAGGTWIATAESDVSLCLLNGGFTKHKRELPYTKSRGEVLKERFNYSTNAEFCKDVNLFKVEPFTLLLIDHSKNLDFTELVWDGKDKHIQTIDTNHHHIWASSTLYNEEQRAMRKSWFKAFIKQKSSIPFNDIVKFHNGSYTKDKTNDLVMQRGSDLKTVSISQINITLRENSFKYLDLINHSTEKLNLNILCKPV